MSDVLGLLRVVRQRYEEHTGATPDSVVVSPAVSQALYEQGCTGPDWVYSGSLPFGEDWIHGMRVIVDEACRDDVFYVGEQSRLRLDSALAVSL